MKERTRIEALACLWSGVIPARYFTMQLMEVMFMLRFFQHYYNHCQCQHYFMALYIKVKMKFQSLLKKRDKFLLNEEKRNDSKVLLVVYAGKTIKIKLFVISKCGRKQTKIALQLWMTLKKFHRKRAKN